MAEAHSLLEELRRLPAGLNDSETELTIERAFEVPLQELDQAREKVRELNRRAQAAESAVREKLAANAGSSYGRSLLRWFVGDLQKRVSVLEEAMRKIKEHIDYAQRSHIPGAALNAASVLIDRVLEPPRPCPACGSTDPDSPGCAASRRMERG